MRHAKLAATATMLGSLLLVGAGCFSMTDVTTTPTNSVRPAEPPDGGLNSAINANGDMGTSMDMRIAGNAIIVGDQRPGEEIAIELVETDRPTVVVIRANDYQTGPVIGTSALLRAGNNTGVVVRLSRPSVDGETLYAVAYADDGDGVYDAGDNTMLNGAATDMYSTVNISNNADTDPLLPRI